MPYPDDFSSAAYQQRWGGEADAERNFLRNALRQHGSPLIVALAGIETPDKHLNEACHTLARELEERMAELAKWGNL